MNEIEPTTKGSDATTRKTTLLPMDRQRADFLRSCRARISPEELGLPAPQRKRTEGLRREDVAALSGVSVAWYTWLEQGRTMRVSDEVLERICHTFRLSEDERSYLFTLVQHRPPRLHPGNRAEMAPEILRMIEGISVPALVMNMRWDVLAWNRLNAVLFRDYGLMPPTERNLLELLFTQPSYFRETADFEDMARRILAKFRVQYGESAHDPRFETLVRRLDAVSPLFRRLWRTPEINVKFYGLHRYTHERFGDLRFENTSYVPDGHPGLRVIICRPDDDVTRQVVAQVLLETDVPASPAG